MVSPAARCGAATVNATKVTLTGGKMVDSMVRAMTWNLWWRFGPHWKDRQPAIRVTLERLRPDVVAFQEVWATEETTQAHELADLLGLHAAFASPSYPPAPLRAALKTGPAWVSALRC